MQRFGRERLWAINSFAAMGQQVGPGPYRDRPPVCFPMFDERSGQERGALSRQLICPALSLISSFTASPSGAGCAFLQSALDQDSSKPNRGSRAERPERQGSAHSENRPGTFGPFVPAFRVLWRTEWCW